MPKKIYTYIKLAGVASITIGVVLAAHHHCIEIPIVAGLIAIYVGWLSSK